MYPLYDGRGAAIAGGRWNEKGVRVIDSAESIALCRVEVMVHTPVHRIKNYVLGRIDIPDSAALLDFADLNRTVIPLTEFERRAREVIRRVGEPPASSIYGASGWVRAHAVECLEIGRLWLEYPGYLGLLVHQLSLGVITMS